MHRLEFLSIFLLAFSEILSTGEQRSGRYYNNVGGGPGGSGSGGSRNQYKYRSHQVWGITREVRVKYGRLRGMVVRPRADNLQPVDVFLGKLSCFSLTYIHKHSICVCARLYAIIIYPT